MQRVRTWSSLVFSFCFVFLCLALILRDLNFIYFSPFMIDVPYWRSPVAWLDDEPALLVSYGKTPNGARHKVDERRAEAAVWVARYYADKQG